MIGCYQSEKHRIQDIKGQDMDTTGQYINTTDRDKTIHEQVTT